MIEDFYTFQDITERLGIYDRLIDKLENAEFTEDSNRRSAYDHLFMKAATLGDAPGRLSIQQGMDDIYRMKEDLQKMKEEVQDYVNPTRLAIAEFKEHECLGCVYLQAGTDGKPSCFNGNEKKTDDCYTPRPT